MLILKLNKTKFYQASTSELFGKVNQTLKMKILNLTSKSLRTSKNTILLSKNYESHGLFCANGILFNKSHQKRRNIVTRKITRGEGFSFGSGKNIFREFN